MKRLCFRFLVSLFLLSCQMAEGQQPLVSAENEMAQRRPGSQRRGGRGVGSQSGAGAAAGPSDYWLSVDLPEVSQEARAAHCRMNSSQLNAYYRTQRDKAEDFSDRLEEYIRAWYRGEKPARLPQGLLPSSMDNAKTHSWTLQRPEEIRPEKQWYYAPARQEPAKDNFQKLYQSNAATHVTYLKLIFASPLDAELLVEGDFPHARQMSFHILEPFDPEFPVTINMGVMEVPMIDVDIDPDAGHVNPFRPGADRRAAKRHYHVAFDLKAGNAAELNPVMRDKHFRARGNRRVGGPFGFAGPWGGDALIHSLLWLRYYAPDLEPDGSVDPLAGVDLPKALLRLKTGETFWLQANIDLAVERQLTTAPGRSTPPLEPPAMVGASRGWIKFFNILLTNMESRAMQRVGSAGDRATRGIKAAIRRQMACFFNVGPRQKTPGNIGHSATDHPYHSYLVRPFFLGRDKVYVLTGKLPTTPSTREGESRMESAQARYWSICHTGDRQEGGIRYNSLGYGCLMDDEIHTDAQGRYMIAYSRGGERPSNARAECGVTWQDFGLQSNQSFVIRWMSVYPDHYMKEYVPNDENIPWERGSWSESRFDQTLVGENRPGVMGPYHPVVHYLDREEFEALGCDLDPERIPEWKSGDSPEQSSPRRPRRRRRR